MSNVSGTVLAYVPSSRIRFSKAKGDQPGPDSRFTPLLPRETSIDSRRKHDEMRTFSAICFPGWERG